MPQQLKKILDSALTEIRGKRSLQYGLLAMALLFCGEMLLQWSDWQEAQEKQWQQLRSELRTLRNQSRDEATLRNQLNALETQQMLVDERLWRVSSEAVGQARLKDWLTEQLKKAGVTQFKLSLSTPVGLNTQQTTPATTPPAPGKTPATELYELRANLTYAFTPSTLEDVLLTIEGSKALAAVESLKVSRRDRSVDMGIRILVHIQAEAPPETAQKNQDTTTAPSEPTDKADKS